MIDHSPAAGGPPSVDLLVVGGMTVDVFADGSRAAGGAARYAVEGAVADGLRVALLTISGPGPDVASELERLAGVAVVSGQSAASSIRFEHHGDHESRRLRLTAHTEPITAPEPGRLPAATAVLFAPVAGEVGAEVISRMAAPLRAAGLQGWLRQTDVEGWVSPRPLAAISADVADALRDLDLLVVSHLDLGIEDPQAGLAALRGWAGSKPELVVTAGVEGAWLDDGHFAFSHVPAEAVRDRSTIGAGDAFVAVLAARRATGMALADATTLAAAATARYLTGRSAEAVQPTEAIEPTEASQPAPPNEVLAALEGTAWLAIRFGAHPANEPPPQTEFSLQVFSDRLAGKSGCNRYMGGWKVEDGRLVIGPLASSMMWCEGLMDLERDFLEAIQSVTAARMDGGRLVMLAGDTPVAEFARARALA